MKFSLIVKSVLKYLVGLMLFYTISGFALVQQYSISPGHLKFDLKNSEPQLLWIKNSGSKPITLAIKPLLYSLKTLHLGRYLNEKVSKESDLSPYILVSPRILTLQPMQTREVRVVVRKAQKFLPGSYYAHLLIYPIVNLQTFPNSKTSGLNLKVKMALAVAIHGNYGHGEPKLKLQCKITQQHQLQLTIHNPTIWMFDGKLFFYHHEGMESTHLFKIMHLIVPRESERTMLLNWVLSPEKTSFVLKWKGDSPNITSGTTVCH